MAITQDDRPLGVETVLGKDVLLLQSFTGEEQISGLFSFSLQMSSTETNIRAEDIIGTVVSFHVLDQEGEKRWFNGIFRSFAALGTDDRLSRYEATVVPELWRLSKGADCRVHETSGADAQQIIDQLLSDLGFSNYEWDLTGSLQQRKFCVQYRETHLEFLERLLQEEGIFYYFRHEQGKHTLVLTDHKHGVFDCRDAEVTLLANASLREAPDQLYEWHHNWEFTTGRYAHSDYNFETPSTSLLRDVPSVVSLNGNSHLEFYDFPGVYGDPGQGDSLARLRIESEEAHHNTVHGVSYCRSFSPGGKFTVKQHHHQQEEGTAWVLLSVHHQAELGGGYHSGSGAAEFIYRNRFRCLPAETVYRPPYKPRPKIFGIQTAVVVGPSGEEIYTDKFGRVKVQFHWDRLGQKDENSSAWIRVSQVHAGKNWGMMDLPRIGEEVVVSFLEGDPDRPLITGRVYNGENAPPFGLPGEKTRRGNTTKSHQANGYNEMSMDDTAGNEQIRINAQYNMDTSVGNNQTLKVGVDRSEEIGNNDTISVGTDQALTVGANQTISIGALMKLTVGSEQQIEIGAARSTDVAADDATTVGAAQSLTVGADRDVSVSGNQTTDVGLNVSLSAGAKITLEATASIELICGGSTIKIDPTGIKIKGAQIAVEGLATASIKSPRSTVEGTATLTLQGGMTKIN